MVEKMSNSNEKIPNGTDTNDKYIIILSKRSQIMCKLNILLNLRMFVVKMVMKQPQNYYNIVK